MPFNQQIRGWMTVPELKVLESWAKGLAPGSTIVEVGSFYGRSSYCLAASAPECKIYCFDQWAGETESEGTIPLEMRWAMGFPLPGMRNTHEQFLKNTAPLSNLHSKRVFTPEQAEFDDPIDLFFIDASHSNPSDWAYIEYFLPKIKRGGWISGHDYFPHNPFPDVTDNINRLQEMFGKAETYSADIGLWRIKVS